jgi:glycerophosphoryl diester phosphodiesterase
MGATMCGLVACSPTAVPARPLLSAAPEPAIALTTGSSDPPSPNPTEQSSASAAQTPSCDAPPVIAHRGEGGSVSTYPENTSAAELDAITHGASIMNVNVQWTADNVPVALHDTTLNRTTSGTGPVSAITSANFIALTLKNNDGAANGAHLHPQTLAQLLAAVRGSAVPIVIQMESDPFAAGGEGQAAVNSLVAAITASGYASQIVVAGWTAGDVHAFHQTDPAVRVAYIQETSNPTADAITATGAQILYIDYVGVTAAEVAAWHHGGVAVWVWTPPGPSQWTALRAMGVDAIATNWIPTYTQWATPCPVTPL